MSSRVRKPETPATALRSIIREVASNITLAFGLADYVCAFIVVVV